MVLWREKRARPDCRRPGGFTLFEVVLVLALITLIGALTMPGFSRTFENQRLRESGDIIRTAWAKGRIEAMKSGRTMLFRHELGGNRYILEPWHGNDEYLELGDAAAETMVLVDEQLGRDTSAAPTEAYKFSMVTFGRIHMLPKGIMFFDSAQEVDVRNLQMTQQMGMDATLSTAYEWSPPILFYPDGSASQAQLRMTNSTTQRFVQLRLRGLTGIAYVSDILIAAELEAVSQ